MGGRGSIHRFSPITVLDRRVCYHLSVSLMGSVGLSLNTMLILSDAGCAKYATPASGKERTVPPPGARLNVSADDMFANLLQYVRYVAFPDQHASILA